jgi:membrane fusion protein (multidrug efflux system)
VARTALAKKRIYAPFTGKLGISQVDIGEYVPPGRTIVTLLSLDRLYLDFTLPEDNFNDLAIGQKVSFQVRSYPDRGFYARVETWSPELDADTRNIQVRAIVDNSERLLAPGMFADMELRSKRKIEVLAIPETAIFYNIYGEAVYVLESADENGSEADTAATGGEPDYRLAARQIRVAYRENGMAGVVEGIEAGDRVVTAGQLKLYPGLKVAIVDDVPEYSRNSLE